MDLYIQVGVLLLFLSALSLFIHIYTQPVGIFQAAITEKNSEISSSVEQMKDQSIREAHFNPNLSGSKLINLINLAESKNIAVLVQTRNQQSLVVNYGPQLRPANYESITMSPAGISSSGSVTSNFDLFYVSTVNAAFFQKSATPPQARVSIGQGFPTTVIGNAIRDLNTATNLNPVGSQSYLNATTGGTYGSFKLSTTPTTKTLQSAVASGETLTLTGHLYTDNVLKNSVNKNFSYLKNENSVYFINPTASFYTTTIVGANNEVIGVYAEEHGTNSQGLVLGTNMYWSNITEKPY